MICLFQYRIDTTVLIEISNTSLFIGLTCLNSQRSFTSFRALVASFSESQLNRYEMYRRASFPKAAIRRVGILCECYIFICSTLSTIVLLPTLRHFILYYVQLSFSNGKVTRITHRVVPISISCGPRPHIC